MPNVQMPLVGLTATQKVACAILCCDEKDYSFANGRDPALSCTRMGSKKHSCVTHTLRERDDNGRLKSPVADRFKDVSVPSNTGQQISVTKGAKKIKITIIPDTLVKKGNDWHAIDAKFPCDLDSINKDLGITAGGKTKIKPKFCCLSTTETGKSRSTIKEKEHYLQYKKDGKKVKTSTCMSPQDAEDLQKKPKSKGGGFECDCTDINKL